MKNLRSNQSMIKTKSIPQTIQGTLVTQLQSLESRRRFSLMIGSGYYGETVVKGGLTPRRICCAISMALRLYILQELRRPRRSHSQRG